NLKQLESECADVAFDFVQVVFRDALLLIGSLPRLPEQEHSLSFSQYSAYRKVFGLGTMLNGTGRVPPSSKPDIRVTSPCLSNEERVYFPDEVSRLPELAKPIKSRDGPMPNAHLSLDRVQSRILRQRLRRALRTAARLLLRFGGLLSPAGTKPAFPTSGPGGAGSSNGNSDNRNRDEATSVLFIAVMGSSMTSIFILAVIASCGIKMCKASE
uniref:Conserved plasma membrane protein n=1 Tax=Macrostomum lignano TaxID=282301 RepID=A0A1I8FH79_9PLAT